MPARLAAIYRHPVKSLGEEALERVAHREQHGDSDHAFGWSWLKEATLWRGKGCSHMAAE